MKRRFIGRWILFEPIFTAHASKGFWITEFLLFCGLSQQPLPCKYAHILEQIFQENAAASQSLGN